jgi:hypothetical protein
MASKNSFRLPMRGRYVNPRIFENYELDDAERDTKLPVFKTLVGLWCHADRAGRFVWDLRKLQIHLFPFQPQIDLAAILDILVKQDVVRRYEVDRRQYGWLVTFRVYQYLAGKEPPSLLPPHPEDDLIGTESAQGGTGAAQVAEADAEADQGCMKTDDGGLKTNAEIDGTSKHSVKDSVKTPQLVNSSQSQSSESVQVSPGKLPLCIIEDDNKCHQRLEHKCAWNGNWKDPPAMEKAKRRMSVNS